MHDELWQIVPLTLAQFDWTAHGTTLLRMVLLVWLTAMGAFIGSFMNVVIYRLPEGLSLSYPGSRCPICLHPIRAYDNIPVISWLLLGARCRDCSTPIPARYPTVEALMAAIFFVMALIGLWAHPAMNMAIHSADEWRLLFDVVLPIATWMLLVSTLVCSAMMEHDQRVVPTRLFVPAIVVGCVASLTLQHVPLTAPDTTDDSRLLGIIGLFVGAGWGALIMLVGFFQLEHESANDNDETGWHVRATKMLAARVGATTACGVLFGWQAVTLLVVAVVTCHLIDRSLQILLGGQRQVRWMAYLAIGSVLLAFSWQYFLSDNVWAGSSANYRLLVGALPFVVIVAILATIVPASEPIPAETKHQPGETPVTAPEENLNAILNSPSYTLAEEDTLFLKRKELRPVRMQLELLKPEMLLAESGVNSTIVVFGGTQVVEREAAEARLAKARDAAATAPDDSALQREVSRSESILAKSRFYDDAREFARLVSSTCQVDGKCDYVVVTGGGPGIMEAANRGAFDVNAKSIGLNITLPFEQAPNPYVTPELCFQFHYFALRKFHFLLRAQALVVFPGGYGTLDELFNTLTLRQTQRMQEIPIILFGKEYWEGIVNFQRLADEGVIRDEHLDLIQFADTPAAAWAIIRDFDGEPHPNA